VGMVSFIKTVKRYLSPLEIKFYCCLLAFSISVCIVISYWQYRLAIQNILKNIESSIAASRQELNDSFDSYNAIFNIISSKINEGREKLNERRISDLLKQFHTTSKNLSNTKISFLDINWQGVKGDIINRYGALPLLNLDTPLETHVRTYPKQPFLHSAFPENKISSTNDYFLTWGVINSKNVYIGKLTILLDLKTWMHELGSKLQDQGLIAILVDHKTSLSSNNAIFDVVHLQDKLPIKLKDFTITNDLLLKPQPYKLLFGYNKLFLYKQAFQRTIPLLLVFWCSMLIFVIAQFVYTKMLKSDIFAGFKSDVKALAHENLKHKQIEKSLLEQLDKYKHETTSYNNKINASKISSKAKEDLELQIRKRFTSTIIELIETARVIGQSIEGVLSIKMDYGKQVELLVNINNKLASIVRGYVCNEKNDKINLEVIINDTIKIFAEEIFEQKLSIKARIKNKNNNLYHDELLLKQILANLLRESISCSKPNSTIKIFAHNEFIEAMEHLVVKITDDGFGIPNDNEEQQAILPLMLDSQSIKALIESNGGQLEIEYMVGHGKTITCSLPYKDTRTSLVKGSNVIVLFKKN
jgi:hypothetical protein